MNMIRAPRVRAALVAVAGSILLLALPGGQARAGSGTVLEGTGTFSSQVVRTTETLDPPCVSLVTRNGNVAFTGLITNTLQNGDFVSHALRDACATPVQGPSKQTYELHGATVAGKKGDLVVEAEGIFEGDATTPPGARSRYQLKIWGVSGDFKGAEGEGQSVGIATGFPGVPATSSNTYYVTIRLKK